MKKVIRICKDYLADSSGKIYSLKRKKFLKPFISNSGYYIVSIGTGKTYKKYSVHRLIAETFLKKTNSTDIVNHKDGNKLNNSVKNLEWTTYSKNIKHAFSNGRNIPRIGEKHFAAKLSNKEVRQIRKYLNKGYTYGRLSKMYNVTTSCIGSIKRKTRRKHD